MDKRLGYLKYKNIIELTSERWLISKELICAFCFVESSFEREAKRYEQGFYNAYIKRMNLPEEEAEWRSTSWSLMQIMGQVAREVGYRGTREELSDPTINLYYCCKYFNRLLNRYKGNRNDAIAAYNQGNNGFCDIDRDGIKDKNEKYSNQNYVDAILKNEKEFKTIILESDKTDIEKNNDNVYIVKSGDNLEKISKLFNINIDDIVRINKIGNMNFIYPGQKLLLK